MTRTVTARRLFGRDHWAVTRSPGGNGPWLVQRAHSLAYGYRLDAPLPGHANFATKKAAVAFKRTLP